MNQTLNATTRKFNTITHTDKIYKSGPSTGFRVTERRSNSVLINPETIINNTNATQLSTQENLLNLPLIAKRRKQKKQGGFLESWLDQALGSPDPFTQPQQTSGQFDKVDTNVLKTLKKFELDKRYLQSKSIPPEKIDRMYQSLYIYSHGVNKVFQQILQFVKQIDNNDLLGNFWRAYTKLLQGCTSYQTVFQKVQRDHLSSIRNLKHTIQMKSEIFSQEKKELEERIHRLQRINEEKQNKYNQLLIEYEALQNTLTLTDQAFNEQVNLRLKFEQKINAIYTTYEELKSKYTRMLEEMSIKNVDIIDRENKENQLKNKLLIERTKVDELMFLLKSERDKVAQRETQLIIKNQQIEDIRAILLAKNNEEGITHDKMEEHLSKLKAVKAKLTQAQHVISGQKLNIKHQQEHIEKISATLQQHKQQNNEVYEKYMKSGKKVVELQTELSNKMMKIEELENVIKNKTNQIINLEKELEHTKGQRENLRNQLEVAVRNLKDTKQTMKRNSLLLQQMKAVKDKYQRINQILKEQFKNLEEMHNKANQQISLKVQQCEGLKLLVDSRNKTITQLEKQAVQEREMNKNKHIAFQSTIAKKQELAMNFQKKYEEIEKQLSETKIQFKKVQDKAILLQSANIKYQVELNSKIKLIKDIESLLDTENVKYKELASELQGSLKQKFDISSKLQTTEFVLKTKTQQQKIEITILTGLLNEYKVKLMARAQYIHPMILEDALERVRRFQERQQIRIKKVQSMQSQIRMKQSKIKGYWKMIQELKQKTTKIQKQNSLLTQQKASSLEKLKKAEQNIRSMGRIYQKQQNNNKNLIEQTKNQQNSLKQKIQALQLQKVALHKQIQELIQKNNRKSAELKTKIKPVQKIQREIQTQNAEEQKSQVKKEQPKIELKAEMQKIEKMEKGMQTQISAQKQKQIEISANVTPIPSDEFEKQVDLVSKRDPLPVKKVQSKDFKKALKLTYMRR